MAFSADFSAILFVLMSGGGLFSGGGLLGLPPGERDASFLKCAPAETLVYSEWAARSKGKAGAPGIDGLAADIEVRMFVKELNRAISEAIEQEAGDGPPEAQIVGKVLPPLIKTLLTRPGCLYATIDPAAAKNALQPEGPIAPGGALIAGLRATLIVNAGDDADAMAAQIDQLIDLMINELAIEKTEKLQRQKIPLPLPGSGLTIHRHEKYFIVGFGEGTIDAAIAGLSGKIQGLQKNARFAAAMKQVQMKRTAALTWLDVKQAVASTTQAVGQQGEMINGMAKMIGADAIDSIVSSTGVVDGQIRTKSYVTTGGKQEGVLALAAGRAIVPGDFSQIPADADFVFAGSLNGPKVLAAVRQIVGAADPESKQNLESYIEAIDAELGVSLEKDVFAAFGDLWTIYDSPAAGGLFVSAPVLSLEVRDSKKADVVVTQLMNVLKEALPGERGNQFRRRGVMLEKTMFLDQTLYYINTIGDDVPIAPTLCLTDKQLLVALHPQPLKAHLRFLKSNDEKFPSRFGKDLKLPAGELLSLTYFDAKKLVQFAYGFTPYLGQLILSQTQREGFPLDISSLPSGRAILPYVGTSLATTVRTKEGILVDSQSALPIPGGSVGVLTLPLPYLMLGTMRMRPILQREAPAAPAVMNAKALILPRLLKMQKRRLQQRPAANIARPLAP